jgi:hypothetical protein
MSVEQSVKWELAKEREVLVLGVNFAPIPLCPPQIPHDLTDLMSNLSRRGRKPATNRLAPDANADKTCNHCIWPTDISVDANCSASRLSIPVAPHVNLVTDWCVPLCTEFPFLPGNSAHRSQYFVDLLQYTCRDSCCMCTWIQQTSRNKEFSFCLSAVSCRSDIEKAAMAQSQLTASEDHLFLFCAAFSLMRSLLPIVVKPNRAWVRVKCPVIRPCTKLIIIVITAKH